MARGSRPIPGFWEFVVSFLLLKRKFPDMKTEIAFIPATKGAADAMALQLLDDSQLGQQVRDTAKLSIERLRQSLGDAITACGTAMSPAVDSVQVHQRLLKGLPGEAMFIASAMAFDTFREGEVFFGLSAKTARQRIGRSLDAGEGEKALRLVRALSLAASALGSAEEARAYLKTPNFALGGMTPRELLLTAEGEQLVLNELQTHRDGGPV